MNALDAVLRRIVRDLDNAHRLFALIGGLAVSVRAEPRFTRDADLAVVVADDADAEALVHRLRILEYRDVAVVEQEATGRLATVRLTLSEAPSAPVVDLLFASSGIEPEVVAAAEPIELLAALTTRVARTSDLIALKVLSRDDVNRPQDQVDLRALLKVATTDDLSRTNELLALITTRGYHRGRDLAEELARLVAR